MDIRKDSFKAIAVYLVITVALSSIFYILLAKGSQDGPQMPFVAGLMWSPGLAAIITSLVLRKKISEFGWRWGMTKYNLLSYVLPIIYGSVAYGLVWTTGLGAFHQGEIVDAILGTFGLGGLPSRLAIPIFVLLTGTVGFVPHFILALGEEIGWRGFLVPELSRNFSYTKTALVNGAIWSVWHYPYILFGGYNAGAPMWYSLALFTAGIIAASFLFAWLRLKSGSLWTGVFLHASHNAFIQDVFDPLTKGTAHTKYFTGEFGLFVPLAIAVAAYLFWRRRADLPVATGQGAAEVS